MAAGAVGEQPSTADEVGEEDATDTGISQSGAGERGGAPERKPLPGSEAESETE